MRAAKLQKLAAFPQAAKNFILQARDELKKVSWPSRELTIRYTIIVIVASLVVGIIIGGIDYLFTFLVEQFI